MLTLLTVAVAAAIGFATAAYNVAPVTGNTEFGTANHSFVFEDSDPDTLQPVVAAGEEWFGSIDAIGHRAVPVAGSVDTVDYRAQDPDGPYGSPLLDLRDGRYPASDDEIAVTDGVADTFAASVGATFALDGVGGPSSVSSRTRATSTTSSPSCPVGDRLVRVGDDARRRLRGAGRLVPACR